MCSFSASSLSSDRDNHYLVKSFLGKPVTLKEPPSSYWTSVTATSNRRFVPTSCILNHGISLTLTTKIAKSSSAFGLRFTFASAVNQRSTQESRSDASNRYQLSLTAVTAVAVSFFKRVATTLNL